MPPRAEIGVQVWPFTKEYGPFVDSRGRESTVRVYPGQGIQRENMWKTEALCVLDRDGKPTDVFKYPKITALYKEAEQILGYSLLTLTNEQLARTDYAQPAIFVFSEACRTAQQIEGKLEDAPFHMGNSLGEYNALYEVGAFDSFADALRLVAERGKAMQHACEVTLNNQTGLCVFYVRLEKGEKLSKKQKEAFAQCSQHLTDQSRDLYLEADNSESQIVFGSTKTNIAEAKLWFEEWLGEQARKEGKDVETLHKELKLTFFDVNVPGAFHSPYMNKALELFMPALNATKINSIEKPLVANTTAMPIQTELQIRRELAAHMIQPVLWRQSNDFLEKQGVAVIKEIGIRPLLINLVSRRGTLVAGAAAAALLGAGAAGVVFLRQRRRKK